MTSFAERVSKAAIAVHALFAPTPLQENDYLSKKTGARVLLKREDLTPVRSYKIRGAFNFSGMRSPPAPMPNCSSARRPGITRRGLRSSAAISADGVWSTCR